MSQVETVKFAWNARDADVLRSLKRLLKDDNLNQFSADDIFLFGLDRFFSDKVHDIGGWFASALHFKLIRKAGFRKRSVRPSSHMRLIEVYVFVEKELEK